MQPDDSTDRLWTIPNALSVLRLLGVPLFLCLLLGPHADAWALVVLAALGLHRLARRRARPGAEPAQPLRRAARPAGRPALHPRHAGRARAAARHAAVARDRHRRPGRDPRRRCCRCCAARATAPPAVHYLGKAATFCLLYAFPLLLLGTYHSDVADVARADRVGLHDLGHRALRLGRRGVPPPGDRPDPAPRPPPRRRRLVTTPEPPEHPHRPRRSGRAPLRCSSTSSRAPSTRATPRPPAGAAPTAARGWYDRPAVAIGCLLAGFVLVVGYLHAHRSAPAEAKAHTALVKRVRAAQGAADGLAEPAARASQTSLATGPGQRAAGRGRRGRPARPRRPLGEVAVTGPG